MTHSSEANTILSLVQDSFAAQQIPDEPHVLDDQAFVARWADDRLTSDEQRSLIDHLTRCPQCRRALNTMIECGLLSAPTADFAQPVTDTPQTRTEQPEVMPTRIRSFRSRLALTATVAALLFAGVWFVNHTPRVDHSIAQLDYRLDRDFGYTLDGFKQEKAGGSAPLDASQPRSEVHQIKEYQTSIARSPNSVELRINYGYLLLKSGKIDEALSQSQKAVDLSSENPACQLLLGNALFAKARDRETLKASLAAFETALKLDPENFDALLNRAITLQRLSPDEPLYSEWEKVLERNNDDALRRSIIAMFF